MEEIYYLTKNFNFTIGAEGFRPTELFHGRYVHGRPFEVNIEALANATILLRKCVQKSIEKKRFSNTKLRPYHFVPYEKGMEYNDKNNMPIKLGDIFMIDEGGFLKENYRPLYKVIKTPGFLSGINWDTGLVACKKLDLKNEKLGKIFLWEMNWIIHIINGDSDSIDLKEMSDFVDKEIKSESKELYGTFDVTLYI